jgi:1-acyl-sn-glycerol-3-phosphate acyltransferase
LLERGTSVAFLVGSLDRPDLPPTLRSGPVRAAATAGVQILPMVMRDSNALVTRRPPVVRPGTIHVDVGAPIAVTPSDVDTGREAVVNALA